MLFLAGLLVWAYLHLAAHLGFDAMKPATALNTQDPALARAVRLSQETPPQSIGLLAAHRHKPYRAALLIQVPQAGQAEEVWLSDAHFALAGLAGTVAAEPQLVTKVHKGEHISVETESVVDWAFSSPDVPTQGYVVTCYRAAVAGKLPAGLLGSEDVCAQANSLLRQQSLPTYGD